MDQQLQAEVESGQLERGNSEWASPPFATKEFGPHRRQRKRRLVVDYRRVNMRTLRAIYFVRDAAGVVRDVMASVFFTFLDACKGFNQVANTERARKMLAILARSGQYLPRCLTFGPHNGPEDFAFATDRVFAPGRNRRMRLCRTWQIYADDNTIRTGRVLDGVMYSDGEIADRIKDSIERKEVSHQSLESAFEGLGVEPCGVGQGKEGRQVDAEVDQRRAGSWRIGGHDISGPLALCSPCAAEWSEGWFTPCHQRGFESTHIDLHHHQRAMALADCVDLCVVCRVGLSSGRPRPSRCRRCCRPFLHHQSSYFHVLSLSRSRVLRRDGAVGFSSPLSIGPGGAERSPNK